MSTHKKPTNLEARWSQVAGHLAQINVAQNPWDRTSNWLQEWLAHTWIYNLLQQDVRRGCTVAKALAKQTVNSILFTTSKSLCLSKFISILQLAQNIWTYVTGRS